MSKRHHAVITGTGRAGTTFLVELLTHLGCDTGFTVDTIRNQKDRLGRGGLEHDLRQDNCPYVVKNPWFCDHAREVFERGDIVIDHIYIPIRELNAAAESRRFVAKAGTDFGGLWHTTSSAPDVQENILLRQIYTLLLEVSDTGVPVTLIRYPRLAKDASYLFRKLGTLVSDIGFPSFCQTFNRVVRPELIHRFNENDG